jgi:hypothetical protein
MKQIAIVMSTVAHRRQRRVQHAAEPSATKAGSTSTAASAASRHERADSAGRVVTDALSGVSMTARRR